MAIALLTDNSLCGRRAVGWVSTFNIGGACHWQPTIGGRFGLVSTNYTLITWWNPVYIDNIWRSIEKQQMTSSSGKAATSNQRDLSFCPDCSHFDCVMWPLDHWSPISLVPHLIGSPSHWSPISLIPHLIDPPISTHAPLISLVPHLIGPPDSLVPHLIGPPSHWSPSDWCPNS